MIAIKLMLISGGGGGGHAIVMSTQLLWSFEAALSPGGNAVILAVSDALSSNRTNLAPIVLPHSEARSFASPELNE